MEGTVTETSVSDPIDEIRSVIRITYPSDMFEFAEALSKHLEYAPLQLPLHDHRERIEGLRRRVPRGTRYPFRPSLGRLGIDRAGGEISDRKVRVGKSLKIRPYGL